MPERMTLIRPHPRPAYTKKNHQRGDDVRQRIEGFGEDSQAVR